MLSLPTGWEEQVYCIVHLSKLQVIHNVAFFKGLNIKPSVARLCFDSSVSIEDVLSRYIYDIVYHTEVMSESTLLSI